MKFLRNLARQLWNNLSARWVMDGYMKTRSFEINFFKDRILWIFSKISS